MKYVLFPLVQNMGCIKFIKFQKISYFLASATPYFIRHVNIFEFVSGIKENIIRIQVFSFLSDVTNILFFYRIERRGR